MQKMFESDLLSSALTHKERPSLKTAAGNQTGDLLHEKQMLLTHHCLCYLLHSQAAASPSEEMRAHTRLAGGDIIHFSSGSAYSRLRSPLLGPQTAAH